VKSGGGGGDHFGDLRGPKEEPKKTRGKGVKELEPKKRGGLGRERNSQKEKKKKGGDRCFEDKREV